MFANKAAEILQKRLKPAALSFRAGSPIFTGPQSETRRLLEAIDDVLEHGGANLFRFGGKAHAFPLLGVLSRLDDVENGRTLAMLAFRAPDDGLGLSAGKIAKALDLTPAQAEIALALVNGKSVGAIARMRNSKISTVRTHLAEIFARTKTKNQRELIRFLSSVPPITDDHTDA